MGAAQWIRLVLKWMQLTDPTLRKPNVDGLLYAVQHAELWGIMRRYEVAIYETFDCDSTA